MSPNNYFQLGRFCMVIQLKNGGDNNGRLVVYVNSEDSYMIHRAFVDHLNGVNPNSRCIEFEAELGADSSWRTFALDLESVSMISCTEVVGL